MRPPDPLAANPAAASPASKPLRRAVSSHVGPLAQRSELAAHTRLVVGSNPTGSMRSQTPRRASRPHFLANGGAPSGRAGSILLRTSRAGSEWRKKRNLCSHRKRSGISSVFGDGNGGFHSPSDSENEPRAHGCPSPGAFACASFLVACWRFVWPRRRSRNRA